MDCPVVKLYLSCGEDTMIEKRLGVSISMSYNLNRSLERPEAG